MNREDGRNKTNFGGEELYSYKIDPEGTREPTWLVVVPLVFSYLWLHSSIKKLVNMSSSKNDILISLVK